MKERLLFDWIHMHGTGLTPNQSDVFATAILAHTAEAALSVLDQALLGTKLALHALVLKSLPEARRVRSWRLARARLPRLKESKTTHRPPQSQRAA
jgi:hypothetical protein